MTETKKNWSLCDGTNDSVKHVINCTLKNPHFLHAQTLCYPFKSRGVCFPLCVHFSCFFAECLAHGVSHFLELKSPITAWSPAGSVVASDVWALGVTLLTQGFFFVGRPRFLLFIFSFKEFKQSISHLFQTTPERGTEKSDSIGAGGRCGHGYTCFFYMPAS